MGSDCRTAVAGVRAPDLAPDLAPDDASGPGQGLRWGFALSAPFWAVLAALIWL